MPFEKVDPLGSYLGTKAKLQQLEAGKQRLEAGQQAMSLQAKQAEQQQKMQQRQVLSDMANAAEWADTPEKWEQALDMYENAGMDISNYRGRHDLRPAVIALKDPTKQAIALRKLQIDEQTMQQRQAEFSFKKEQAAEKALELKPSIQKMLDTSQTEAVGAGNRAREFTTLAEDINKEVLSGGIGASWGEWVKEQTGDQDYVTGLRKRFNAVRASMSVRNLPPGPASDKDIALALSGFPSEKASGPQMVSFLNGVAKLERVNEAFQTFKSALISKKKNTANMLKSWKKKHKSSKLGKEVTTADIFITAANKNLTPEEVVKKLGIEEWTY